MAARERVGVREMRQNLSVYLDRVKAGEALEVTERGHPVALLQPLVMTSVLQRLAAEGRVRPPRRTDGGTAPPVRLRPAAGGPTMATVLAALQADRA